MDSILNSVKAIVHITEDQTAFDQELIMDINTVFLILNQIGIGPSSVYSITDETNTWDEFLSNASDLEAVKVYMGSKVQSMFDPPQSSSVNEALKQKISELEWRLNFIAES